MKIMVGMPGGEDKDHQAECDLRTLIDAEEIRADSARLRAAKAKAREKAGSLKKITA